MGCELSIARKDDAPFRTEEALNRIRDQSRGLKDLAIVRKGKETTIEQPMHCSTKSYAVSWRVRPVLLHRSDVCSFNLAASATIDELKPGHCTGSVVRTSNQSSESCVSDRTRNAGDWTRPAILGLGLGNSHFARHWWFNRRSIINGRSHTKPTDGLELIAREQPNGVDEGPGVHRTVEISNRRFKELRFYFERNRFSKRCVVRHNRIEMTRLGWVRLNALNPCHCEIHLATAIASRLVVDHPIANGLRYSSKVLLRKMVPLFDDIVVLGFEFCGENCVCHTASKSGEFQYSNLAVWVLCEQCMTERRRAIAAIEASDCPPNAPESG